jgi:hypothetical protein
MARILGDGSGGPARKAGQVICRPPPALIDIGAALAAGMQELSRLSHQDGGFVEYGAAIRRRELGRLELAEIIRGTPTSVTIKIDPLMGDVGTAHTHPVWPGGMPMPLGLDDFETIFLAEEIYSFVVSGPFVMALVRFCFGTEHLSSVAIANEFNRVFTEHGLIHQDVGFALRQANRGVCSMLGLAWYLGRLVDSTMQLIWRPVPGG